MKTRYFLALTLLCISMTGQAQDNFKCGTSEKFRMLYEQDPQLLRDHEMLLRNALASGKSNANKNVIFTIPVVFHILHNYGNENISDAQIYNQMEILNEDFRALNADTNLIIPAFKNLYGDVRIEFKLATKDPSGNCTNGINRIYTHETFNGDDYSKLQQWPRFNYLNVWVVANMENGVAGYAYYPTSVDGLGFFRDGIMIRHNYIGSIGTGSPQRSRALTHEIGHYLGLAHTWGNTNNPGVSCGDDGIPDTPVTRGFTVCPSPQNAQFCNQGIIENYQNFMDYSYCSVMFTKDQAEAMRNILQAESGQRNLLIRPEVPQITGIDLVGEPLCKPKADFHVDNQYVCLGNPVVLFDNSYNGTVSSWEWTINDGPNTIVSNEASPSVVFQYLGYKNIRLRVANEFGEDVLIRNNYIYVYDHFWTNIGPQSFNLNSWNGNASQFAIFNYTDNHARFQYINQHGVNNSPCFKLNNYFNNAGAFPLTIEGMYYNRLGGSKDDIITPAFNLTNTQNVQISFDYAYATNALTLSDLTERIIVYSSRNCGETWIPRRTIAGAELNTMGYANYEDVFPTNSTQWKTVSIPYTVSSADQNTIFKIEFNASDYSGNLYIDNINIQGVLDVHEIASGLQLEVYPNPVGSNDDLTVRYSNSEGPINFVLRDLQGKIIWEKLQNETGENIELSFKMDAVSPGYYFLQLEGSQHRTSKQVIKL